VRVRSELKDLPGRQELRQRAEAALRQISRHISQRALERLLGLSQGYLTRMRFERLDAAPSVPLVALLALLSVDPAQRIKELRTYWAQQVDPVRVEGGTP
jgi:hypothetical protein